jgi:hypothetical protein
VWSVESPSTSSGWPTWSAGSGTTWPPRPTRTPRTRSNLGDVADELVRMKDANGVLTAERDALADQLREAGEQNAAKTSGSASSTR